ncbi:MAG: LysE family transporter [Candidatus Nezhaarchaeales archaeon]
MALDFLAQVVIISASGALAPGPLTTLTATIGAKRGWKAGLLVALGHTAVELPLVILIALGVLAIFEDNFTSSLLALIGGSFLLFFGVLTLKDSLRWHSSSVSINSKAKKSYENPILIGITLSALNPFFIIWWLGVGSPLVYEALRLWSFQGLALMYVSHVWLDFAWLPSVAYLASLGKFNIKFLRALLAALALAILYFAFSFIASGLSTLATTKLS